MAKGIGELLKDAFDRGFRMAQDAQEFAATMTTGTGTPGRTSRASRVTKPSESPTTTTTTKVTARETAVIAAVSANPGITRPLLVPILGEKWNAGTTASALKACVGKKLLREQGGAYYVTRGRGRPRIAETGEAARQTA